MVAAEPSTDKPDPAFADSANVNETVQLLFVVCARDEATTACTELTAELLTDGLRVCSLPEDGGVATVEQLATQHLKVMRQRQPAGPYRVVGAGSAGLVAHEIAFKLLGEDEVVEFLGLIDSRRPKNEPRAMNVESSLCVDYEAYCPQALSIRTHLFAMEHSRDELYREWIGIAGHRLAIETIVTPGVGAASARSVARAIRGARQQAERTQVARFEQSSVLPIQSGKKGSVPVYCVPGAGANVTSFMPLAAALGEEIAVVGLQPRGMEVGQVPHTSVTAAAKAYVQEIMKAERSERYSLVGHSFGGWVVFEMARLLIAAGRHVDSLVLVDTQSPPHDSEPRYYGRIDVLLRLMRTMEQANECSLCLTRADLEQLSYEAQLSTLTDRMKAAGLLPSAARVDAVRSLVRVFSVNVNTPFVAKHRFPGEMLLVQAEEACSRDDLDSDDLDDDRVATAWTQHAAELVRVRSAGNHMTMLKSPNVASLASHIRAYLTRSQVQTAAPDRRWR